MSTKLSKAQTQSLLAVLQARFEKHPARHRGIDWKEIQTRLEAAPAKLHSLQQMEESDGEPDVIGRDEATGEYLFCDCSAESPKGRRSLCYDGEAWEARKQDRPAGNAVDTAAEMGIELLDEAQYRRLQELGAFDLKTSSWIVTTDSVRALGGALFGDRRYDQVFVYHNGAQSYYAARGFRGLLRV